MLFLCLCLLGCCLSFSIGNEIEEFKVNLKAVLNLTEKEIFLPKPAMSEKCICAPDNLHNIVKHLEKLTRRFNDDLEVKLKLLSMQCNMKHLLARLDKEDKVNSPKSCGQIVVKKEVGRTNVLNCYTRFFESLNESKCIKSQ